MKSSAWHPARLVAGLLLMSQLLWSGAGAPPAAHAVATNAVLVWNEAALEGVREAGGQGGAGFKLGPPMVARVLAMVHTCTYDAWAAYDDVAVGTRFGGSLRRPEAERSAANKNKAISFAAYRALVDTMPVLTSYYRSLMTSLGYDYTDASTDTTTPQGIGNVACRAVLDHFHHDGANQLGDLNPGPYSDYTGYAPVNLPMVTTSPIDMTTVVDPNLWQPLTYPDQAGTIITPKPIAPFWTNVRPFALTSSGQFRSETGAAKYGSPEYLAQALHVLLLSATLGDREKCITEYWLDGPRSELPPGHWNLVAQFVSRRDRHSVDKDAKLFFALTNAIHDAGIASWDNKNIYDSVRPITAIRYLFNGVKVLAWGGPGLGTQLIDGGSWHPYQPSWFPTPPFAEYSSGHSTFSAAGAEILKLFTGRDTYGDSVTIAAGSSRVEPGITPAQPVTLRWDTFTDAANEAGISRRYGGIHFLQGDFDARAAGRKVGAVAWAKALTYFNGTAG